MTPGLLADRARQTLAAPTTLLTGVGLHNGKKTSVRLLPAPTDHGRRFRIGGSSVEIPAIAAHAKEAARCTVLAGEGERVQTVEHLMSALAALGVDDCVIELDGGEVPALDGSAQPFYDWICDAGLQTQGDGSLEKVQGLNRPLLITGDHGACVGAAPFSHFRATVFLDYPHPWIGTQAVVFDAVDDDYGAIAPARTFGFVHELESLKAMGLGLGASEENALALGETGYVGTPRFPDELVRHKLLDLIGDLALVGVPLRAQIVAIRPSHACNIRLAWLIAEAVDNSGPVIPGDTPE